MAVAEALGADAFESVLAFASSVRGDAAERSHRAFRAQFPDCTPQLLDTADPLAVAASLFEAIKAEVAATGLQDTVIDVTSFRREELLMLIAILRLVGVPAATNCEVVYVGASAMADWISTGVTGFRSVIGYAGEIWPSRPTRLVVLLGFESERARAIIENYEPSSLILGRGSRSESITQNLFKRNDEFFRDLERQYDNIDLTFEFSARDPIKVATEIDNAIKFDGSANIIIAPLNTKLSTIGAGLYAQRNKQVQICYAPVGSYNEEAYSKPGKDLFILPLTDLL